MPTSLLQAAHLMAAHPAPPEPHKQSNLACRHKQFRTDRRLHTTQTACYICIIPSDGCLSTRGVCCTDRFPAVLTPDHPPTDARGGHNIGPDVRILGQQPLDQHTHTAPTMDVADSNPSPSPLHAKAARSSAYAEDRAASHLPMPFEEFAAPRQLLRKGFSGLMGC